MADQDWERLARMLTERRYELGFPRRLPWARDVLGQTHDRTISDLENARRQNFDAGTLAQVEQWYQWEPGSIADVLAGKEPTPKEQRNPELEIRPVLADEPLFLLSEDQLVERLGTLNTRLLMILDGIADLASERERTLTRIEAAQAALARYREFGANTENLLTLTRDEHGLLEQAAARETGQTSKGQQRRAAAEQAGEPPADDPEDLEPR